jgi:hypothetical protein
VAAQQYVGTKSAWENMGRNAQMTYAAGLYDGLFGVLQADDPITMAATQGASRCFQELELSPGDLADLIDLQYADTSNWRFPPVVVAILGIQEVCEDFINSARAERGLEPLAAR